MSWALGIDLGTSFTAAGVVADGRVEVISLGAHAAAIPSAVFRSDDATLIGDAALVRGGAHPTRLALEFKRQFGERDPILVGEEFITAEALEEALGAWVFSRACEREGSTPSEVVFTFPAFWGAFRRDTFHALARRIVGDDTKLSLVTEPEAAAAYYASRDRVPAGSIVGVYDFGGGTFDASILRSTGDGFEVLGRPAGDDQLGGADLDQALLRYVMRRAELDGDNFDERDPNISREMARLRRDITIAKELLSEELATDIDVVVGSTVTTIRLTRRELEELARPLIEQSMAVFEQALTYASVNPADLHSILLVGGASRMPCVAEALGRRWPARIALDSHPKFAVCLGAALWAVRASTAPKPLPPPRIEVPPPVDALAPVDDALPVEDQPEAVVSPVPYADAGAASSRARVRRLVTIGAAVGVAAIAAVIVGAIALRPSQGSGTVAATTTSVTTVATTLPPTTLPPTTVPTTTIPPTTVAAQVIALLVDQPEVTLNPGGSLPVVVSGTTDANVDATAEQLNGVAWDSTKPDVATASGGAATTITAGVVGKATLTGTLGTGTVTITVDVVKPSSTRTTTKRTPATAASPQTQDTTPATAAPTTPATTPAPPPVTTPKPPAVTTTPTTLRPS